jgi:miniconductance mechanosensitive channel
MAYATYFIAGHPQTRADHEIYVRQQDPTPQGLPVEIFFFTRATDFVPYHAVQREIFSYLLTSLPEFGLRPYQIATK